MTRIDKQIIIIIEDKYNGKRKKRESIFLFGDSEGDNRQKKILEEVKNECISDLKKKIPRRILQGIHT